MTTVHDPTLVSPELVELTRRLGEPSRDLVILAEGNTSERLDDDRLVVKTSGSRMRDVGPEGFVVVDVPTLRAIITSPDATQDDLTRELSAGSVDGRAMRASIETPIHVAVQAVAPAAYVGHTHPPEVVGLLAGVHAAEAFSGAAYSDEAVVLGRPLFVPYAQPGIALGRVFHQHLRDYVDRLGELPRLVLLANHGIVAIGDTVAGVEAISEMAVKAARVRRIAYSTGGLVPLPDHSVSTFLDRVDVSERQQNIVQGRL